MLATHGHVCQSVSCVGVPIRLPDNPQPRSNYSSTRVEPKPGHVRTSACAQILHAHGPVHSPHKPTPPHMHPPARSLPAAHTHPNLTPRPRVPLGIGRGAAQGCSSLERKLPRVIGSARRVKLAHRDSSCLHHAVVRCDNIADPFALCASCLHALEPTTATAESTTTTAIMIAITAPVATTADSQMPPERQPPQTTNCSNLSPTIVAVPCSHTTSLAYHVGAHRRIGHRLHAVP